MTPLPSGLDDRIADGEDLARFLYSSREFSHSGPKKAAFLPSDDRETSVFRHGATPEDSLRMIGLTSRPERTLHAVAIVNAAAIRAAALEPIPDEPPARHAAIRGWPWTHEDPDLRRAAHMELALRIASEARLIRFT